MQKKPNVIAVPERQTFSVVDAGTFLGLSRNSAYQAVKRGQIPSISIGGKLLVPKKRLNQLLDGVK